MHETAIELPYDLRELTRNLVTEDDVPVDNLFSAKQRRLLVEPLYSSWHPPALEGETEPRHFLADSDVGIFSSLHQPPVAPDMFLSFDVQADADYFENEHRAYFMWVFEKGPEVVVEVVSNRKGKEMDSKMQRYARMGILYYVVFDPFCVLSQEKVRVHELTLGGRRYRRRPDFELPEIGLTMQLWRGEFEDVEAEWLRWCDADGRLIATGAEGQRRATQRAEAEAQRAEAAAQRADAEAQRANAAEAELARLRAELQRLKKPRKN
jgi:Uma2 family endonuclease